MSGKNRKTERKSQYLAQHSMSHKAGWRGDANHVAGGQKKKQGYLRVTDALLSVGEGSWSGKSWSGGQGEATEWRTEARSGERENVR